MSSSFSAEETAHNRVNLGRLVKRLERDTQQGSQKDPYLQARGTLQKVKYARILLKNVELEDTTPGSERRYSTMRSILERVESSARALEQTHAPKPPARVSLLSRLPVPAAPAEDVPLPPVELESTPASDLLLSPDDDTTPSAPITLLPTTGSTSTSTSIQETLKRAKSTQKPLQNSAALQEDLTAQLAQMAAQLKANARHFSTSLANDQGIVDEASQKLELNHDVMVRERVRLRDHGGKSSGTTRLVMMILVAVAVLFVWMFLLIRMTGR